MASKTLINGTAYEISGGKTLVNGTAYSIDKGKTLVNGTAYNIEFYVPTYTITITRGSSHSSMWINGVQYNYITTITVPLGTEVHFHTRGDSTMNGQIKFNGSEVVYAHKGGGEALYIHHITSNLSVKLDEGSAFGHTWGIITITEV